jgi:hypothetical protein
MRSRRVKELIPGIRFAAFAALLGAGLALALAPLNQECYIVSADFSIYEFIRFPSPLLCPGRHQKISAIRQRPSARTIFDFTGCGCAQLRHSVSFTVAVPQVSKHNHRVEFMSKGGRCSHRA